MLWHILRFNSFNLDIYAAKHPVGQHEVSNKPIVCNDLKPIFSSWNNIAYKIWLTRLELMQFRKWKRLHSVTLVAMMSAASSLTDMTSLGTKVCGRKACWVGASPIHMATTHIYVLTLIGSHEDTFYWLEPSRRKVPLRPKLLGKAGMRKGEEKIWMREDVERDFS